MKVAFDENMPAAMVRVFKLFHKERWDNWLFCRKAALLLHWWPTILAHVRTASPGFFVVPCAWPDEGKGALREISTEDAKLVKMQQQIADGEPKREARKAKREKAAAADQMRMFNEAQDEAS